jgi:transposase InsO family protein
MNYSNEPSPSGSPNSRHREPLPLCRCPEGRRVPGRGGLPGGRGDPLGLLRLGGQATQASSERRREEVRLVSEIRGIHARSRGVYGAPRVTAELRRRGWNANHKRVERLMRAHGIVGHRPHRRRSLTKPDQGAAPAPDLLGRLFDPDRPDVAWCGDVTWIPTDEGWLSLASVIDLASRHLLGWSMSAHHDAVLVCDALQAAVTTRGRSPMPDTLFPTDRGAEYSSTAWVAACQRLGLRRSMSRTGSCLDNAVAESWFASLKVELVTASITAPGLRPAPPSSAGSPGTTASGCTPPTAICHPSSGNNCTPPSAHYHQPWPHSPGVHLPRGGPLVLGLQGAPEAAVEDQEVPAWQLTVRRRRLGGRHRSLIRVWWSGWLRAACSGQPSEGTPVPLLSREFVLVVGTAGFEPATPCSQSHIGQDCHLRR